jgi:exosortase
MKIDQAAMLKTTATIVIVILLGLIYWASLRWMVNSWLSSDYYSHGFLVPLVSAFFIWSKRAQLKDRKPSFIGIFWLIAGVALYVFNLITQIRYLGVLSLICVLVGLVFLIWGTRIARILAFPLAFLLFMVPFIFIQDLAFSLQYISVHWAAWTVGAAGLPIQTTGTEIYLKDMVFTVGIVCSGINTLVALMALAAVYTYILKGNKYGRTGLFILAFPIAVGANILRIASIIMVAYYADVQTATGWYHDLSSPLFFFIAFLVLALIGWALRFRINYEAFGKR